MAHLIENLRSVRCGTHARFLTILPRIETHARIYFRKVPCPHRKADYIAEAVALAWKWFLRLEECDKDATRFPSVLATFAARAVRSGRRVCGQLKSRDVLSEAAQQRHGFSVGKLPEFSTLNGNPLEEALLDNTQTPPPDQVQFRCDFPAWLDEHGERDRRLICDMAKNERTQDLARQYRLSTARISQKRREFADDWQLFCEPLARKAA